MTNEKLELPERMEIIRQGGQIDIVRKWFQIEAVLVGVFGAYVGWKMSDWTIFNHTSWDSAFQELVKGFPFSALPLIFACAAIWMVYFGVAGLVNRTRITLSLDGISVRHGPLPWPGNIRQERANLKQFYVKKTFERGVLSRYKVQALLRNGEVFTVVNGPGMSSKQASYIQQALRRAFRTGDADLRDAVIAEAGLTMHREGANLEIVKRWFNQTTIGVAVFSAIWLVGTSWITWSWHTRFGKIPLWPINTDGIHGLVLLIQSILVGAGVVMAYRAAADWLNRTRVTLSRERLSVRHGPVPWPGNMVIAVSSIKELQLKQSSWGRRAGTGSQLIRKHEVHAVLTDGRSRKLVGGFDTGGQAQQLKQAIEGFLGLAPVQPGPQSSVASEGISQSNASLVARVMASVFGLLAIAGGIYLIASVGELNRDGATVMSQVIRGLFAAWPLCVGILFVGVANNLKGDRASIFLFCAAFISGAAFFLLLFIYGAKPRYVTSRAVVNTVPAGAQITSVAPGRIFRDCDDCPEMVEIPPGSFMMGSDRDQMQRPVHSVTIAKAFAIGKTEITQGQWRAVMGTNPSFFPKCGDNCPVERVHWQDALEFVRKLSEKTGQKYRLPSESEWEYACRAGGTYLYCGSDDRDAVAFNENRDGWLTHAVAAKQPNAFGLYDMSGSVWEWTADCWHDNYSGAPTDGSAWTTGESCSWGSRVARGGSWFSGPRPVTERIWAGEPQNWNPGKTRNNNPSRDQGTYGLRTVREIQ